MEAVLKDVRRALLSADVHFSVVKQFVEDVKKQMIGKAVAEGLTPSEQLMGGLYETLVELLGGSEKAPQGRPKKVMLVGLNGAGKTTTAVKLACRYAEEKQRPALIACDVYRPGAVEQLQALASTRDIPVYTGKRNEPVATLAENGAKWAEQEGMHPVIFDMAGRLQIDKALMEEVSDTQKRICADAVLLVADGATGQQAVAVAEGFAETVALNGIILTKMDGDTRAGSALSMRACTGVPILWMGMGERVDQLEPFHPDRIAKRILGMGDLVTFAEKANVHMTETETQEMQEKFLKASFNFEDFLSQMRKMRKMGGVGSLLKLLPSMGKIETGEEQEKKMKHQEALILSMTLRERRYPHIINSSRRKRIARGAGLPLSQVNGLLKQFQKMQKGLKGLKGKNPNALKKKLPPDLQGLLGK